MKVKKVLALALCFAMAAGLMACGGKSDSAQEPSGDGAAESSGDESAEKDADNAKGITISLSSWGLTESAAKAAFEGWDAKNTGIAIDNEVLDYDEYLQNLKIKLASGGGPDVFALQPGALLTEFEEYLVDITDMAKESWGDDWESQFIPIYLDMIKKDDGTYVGLPLGSGSGASLLYTDLDTLAKYGIEKAPRTYDELKAACNTVRAKGGVPVVSFVEQDWAAIDLFMNIAGDINQEKMYEAIEGEADWTDPEMVQAFDLYQKCFTEGILVDGQMGGVDCALYFVQERTSPFMIEGSWMDANIELNESYQEAFAAGAVYDTCTIDWNNDGKPAPLTNTVDAVICINKNSEHINEAWQFVEYMAIEGIEAIINNTMLYYPTTVDFEIEESNFLPQSVEIFKICSERLSDGTSGYREMVYSDLKQEIIDQIQLLGLGETTPEDAAAAVQAASEAQKR